MASARPGDFRTYLSLRQQPRPPVDDDFTWTAITSADNQPGTHNLTGGSGKFILPLTDTVTVVCRIKPNFAFDTGSDQWIWSWYVDATHYLALVYLQAFDTFGVGWYDGGTARWATTAAYTTGQVEDVWFDIGVSLDLTTGDTSGVSLNVRSGAGAWSEADTSWDGAADSKTTASPLFEIRGLAGTEGDYDFNYCRVLLSKQATAAQIAAGLSAIREEEIFFPLNGCAIGWDRVNISDYPIALSPMKECERIGGLGRAELRVVLDNSGGEFVDDQYATYTPASGAYNGTTSQRYLRQRPLVWLEHWYANVFESVFFGRVDRDHIARATSGGALDVVEFNAEDRMYELLDYESDTAASYDSLNITDTTEASSLIHSIVRLATRKSVSNYLPNSSFETSALSNSWAVTGSGATLTYVSTGGLLGTAYADMAYGSESCVLTATVTFAAGGTKKLNVGDYYNLSFWLKSSTNCGDNITLAERLGAVTNDSSAVAYTCVAGKGWTKHNVTHTITSTTSDRLVVTVDLNDNVTLSLDGAMLIEDDPIDWFVLNDNQGSTAIESADDADAETYDTCGFVVDTVSQAVDWVVIPEYTSIGEHVRDLGMAALAEYVGFDPAGTFILDSYLDDSYSDPTPVMSIITAPETLAATTEPERANHIIVRGVMIKEDTKNRNVVSLENTRIFEDGGTKIKIEMANGDSFPDAATYGAEFWVDFES